MVEYQLKPSQMLLCTNLCLYLLASIALISCYQLNLISLLLFFLIILLFLYELLDYRKRSKLVPEILSLNLASSIIEWQLKDDNRQFNKYSVYTCRWGILLVLKQSRLRLCMILLADRFINNHDYLDLRYQVLRLNQDLHAS